jgi:hypothetical protein
MAKNEIFLGDLNQGIRLRFGKDQLWISGSLGDKEIPYKPINWSRFDQARKDSRLDQEPTLYERYKSENQWHSDAPDMRSFKLAVEYYFGRDRFRLGGKFFNLRQYETPEEHLCLFMGDTVIWDFGALNGSDDLAFGVAFRRFEDNLERIRERVQRDGPTPVVSWFRRLLAKVRGT